MRSEPDEHVTCQVFGQGRIVDAPANETVDRVEKSFVDLRDRFLIALPRTGQQSIFLGRSGRTSNRAASVILWGAHFCGTTRSGLGMGIIVCYTLQPQPPTEAQRGDRHQATSPGM